MNTGLTLTLSRRMALVADANVILTSLMWKVKMVVVYLNG